VVGVLETLEGRLVMSTVPASQLVAHHAHVAAYAGSGAPSTKVQAHATPLNATFAHPLLHRVHAAGRGAHPFATGSPPSSALTPAQTRHIYSIDKISNLGAGQTIAIVDAYDNPIIFSDTDVFDKQFMTTLGDTTSYYTAYGASSSWLTKATPHGTPAGDTGWGT
jgi:subtilase family serine protease